MNQTNVDTLLGFDGDDVEPGNPVRGHLPFTHIGLPKAQSLDVSLAQHLPSSKYVAVPFSTATIEGQRELNEVLKRGVDLIIIAVGNHNTSRMIDAIVAPFNVPRIHTWTTRGAAAGVVFGIQPGKDLLDYDQYDQLVRAGQVPYLPEVPESEVPNVPERGCSAPVLPGTPLDIGSVALHAARTAINLLQGEEVPTYQVWTQSDQNWEDVSLTVPNALGLEVVEPRPRVERVVVAYAMRLAIEDELRASPKNETGGVFMGRVVVEELRLEYASGPGPHSKRTRNRLALDVRYTQGCIDAVRGLTNNRLRYFGEWHSHPGGDLRPSQDDGRALRRLALSLAANISLPVIIIITLKQDGSLRAKAFTLRDGLVTELPLILGEFAPQTFTAESLGISHS